MRNFARNSKFGINIDFDRSHGSYIHDRNTKRKYLDFFGMYASLPLGYNHKIFQSDAFREEILRTAAQKVNNCEFVSEETLEFDRLFSEYAGRNLFKFFHYCCTGSLAIEAAIKTCMFYKRHITPKILSFHNSFHGINSYGGFVTSRFSPANKKLGNLPEPFSIKVDMNIASIRDQLKSGDITCILVEPIQCSSGDIHHESSFFHDLQNLAAEYDVPVVYDEIQIGFGSTGRLWYFEHLRTSPDIVVYGKKAQLSGIMAKEKFFETFSRENCTKLEVTWDADILDMIRCKYIIRAYKQYNILENVKKQEKRLVSGLKSMPALKNIRYSGLIVGFDLQSVGKRDTLIKKLYKNGLICNQTGQKSIRVRPNLNLKDAETDIALDIIESSLRETQNC